jgi:hypothetical protein
MTTTVHYSLLASSEYAERGKGAICANRNARTMRSTSNPDKVTCKTCRRVLEKQRSAS